MAKILPDFDLKKVHWVTDAKGVRTLAQRLEKAPFVVFDLETTGLDEHAVTGGKANGGIAARVVLASFTLPPAQRGQTPPTYVVPLSHPDSPLVSVWRQQYRTLSLAMKKNLKLAGHHVKFDARYTYGTVGVDLSQNLWWDTMVSASLLDEEESHKLKDLAQRPFGVKSWADFDLRTPGAAERVELLRLGEYAARDTYYTYGLLMLHMAQLAPPSLYEYQSEREAELTAEGMHPLEWELGRIFETVSMPTIRTLCQAEQRGLLVDTEMLGAWDTMYRVLGAVEAATLCLKILLKREPKPATTGAAAANWLSLNDPHALEAWATIPKNVLDIEIPEACEHLHPKKFPPFGDVLVNDTLAGLYTLAPTSKFFKALVAVAIEAGELKVTATTPTGAPKWDAAVLGRQARVGSWAATELMGAKAHLKMAEFTRSWLNLITPVKTIHSTYKVGSVVTGRLSSSDPNMQQVTYALKPVFIPRPDYHMVNLDYSQLELRIAAHIANCIPMIKAFQSGADLHSTFAAEIAGVPLDEVTKDQRQQAKAANFGLIYGMSAEGFREYAENSYGVIMTVDEAVEVRKHYFQMWHGLEDWHNSAKNKVRRDYMAVSPIGRVRHLERAMTSWNTSERSKGERSSLNAPVQGFGSDLMQASCALMTGNIKGWEHMQIADIHIVATVHDSVVLEVPKDRWQECVTACQYVMETGVLEYFKKHFGLELKVPLKADAEVGTRYSFADIG